MSGGGRHRGCDGMPRFSLTTVASAGLESTYATVCNPGSYQSLMPHRYPSVRVMSVRGDTSVAEEHVVLDGRELVMMAKHVATPPYRHETFVIGGDAKGSHIVHELAGAAEYAKPEPGASAAHPPKPRTVITTAVDLRTGRLGMPSWMRGGRDSLRESFAQIMAELAQAAEEEEYGSSSSSRDSEGA